MKNQLVSVTQKESPNYMELYSVVNKITTGFIPTAVKKHSLIVNDVPKELAVNINESVLATVFGNLLQTVISHTANACIRISARLYGKVILLHLKETHPSDNPVFSGNLRPAQQLAEKIGGTISISSDRGQITTIVFSFINNVPLAA